MSTREAAAVDDAQHERQEALGRPPVAGDLHVHFRSMASDVSLWVVAPGEDAQRRLVLARDVVERVASSCTRFDPASALMAANAAGRAWAQVPQECYDALVAARDAHLATDGLFDPRVLRVLTAYGYDRSLPFESRRVRLGTDADPDTGATADAAEGPVQAGRGRRRRTWRPRFDAARTAVRVGREPIDLGGIGKGLAVRWAAGHLRGAGAAALVEAGGDLMALGGGPDGTGWLVAVESPEAGSDAGSQPVAVLRLRDRACATSSIRVRSWSVGGTDVHHIIDPRTGRSADADLRSVTVVGLDPALAEVWSKSLFVLGREGIREAAESRGLAALWVERSGRVGTSRALRPYVAWQAPAAV